MAKRHKGNKSMMLIRFVIKNLSKDTQNFNRIIDIYIYFFDLLFKERICFCDCMLLLFFIEIFDRSWAVTMILYRVKCDPNQKRKCHLMTLYCFNICRQFQFMFDSVINYQKNLFLLYSFRSEIWK